MKDKKIILNVIYGLAIVTLIFGLGSLIMQLFAIVNLEIIYEMSPSDKLKSYITNTFSVVVALGIVLAALIISNLFAKQKRAKLVIKVLIIIFASLLFIACVFFAFLMQENILIKYHSMHTGDFTFYLSSLQIFTELAIVSAIFVPFTIYEICAIKKENA